MGLYRALLALYPASFRRQYGAEMEGIFARRRREAGSWPAVAGLWVGTVFEVLGNAAAVHWDLLRQDLRYTARTLRRSPGFAATVLVVVALGVGANTAAFTVTDFVLVRPLPFQEPERLVKVWERRPGYPFMEPSPVPPSPASSGVLLFRFTRRAGSAHTAPATLPPLLHQQGTHMLRTHDAILIAILDGDDVYEAAFDWGASTSLTPHQ